MSWLFKKDYPFTLFSAQHLLPLAILAWLIVLLYRSRFALRRREDWRKIITYGLGMLLILFEAVLYIWYFTFDRFSLSQSLPFQLCSLSYILTILMLFFPAYRLYEFLYFAGIGGAMQALLTPTAILSGFPHFTYFYFFLGHGAIVWVALYMTWVHGYRPTWRSIGRVLLALNGLLAVITPLNYVTGGNYFFVAYKPFEGTLLDLLGPWPWYLLSLEGVAIILFTLMYLPFMRYKSDDYTKAR